MAYGFNDDKSKVEVVNYPSLFNGGSNNFTLSNKAFQKTLTKTSKSGFFFVVFDELPQGITGRVDVYLDDSGHQIAYVPLNTYTKTIMGYVPIKKGHTLYCKLTSSQNTASVRAIIYDVV